MDGTCSAYGKDEEHIEYRIWAEKPEINRTKFDQDV
jgi:hypothetical protein